MWLFLALVLVPIIEIALFIQVGGVIGLWPTLGLVLLTGLAGSWLIRRQGLGALVALRASVGEMRDPARPLFDGAAVIFAGALLLAPGFLTDTMGLALLVPAVRGLIYGRLRRRITVFVAGAGPAPRQPAGDVLEGDYTELREAGMRPDARKD